MTLVLDLARAQHKQSPLNPFSTRNVTCDKMGDAVDSIVKELSVRKIKAIENLGVNFSDLCFALKDKTLPELPYLDSLTSDVGGAYGESDLQRIVDELQCDFSLIKLDAVDSAMSAVALIVNSSPPWTFSACHDSLQLAAGLVFNDAVKFMIRLRQ